MIHEVPVTANNVANSHRLFGTNIFARSGINRVDYLHNKAEKFFDAFDIISMKYVPLLSLVVLMFILFPFTRW